MSPSADHLIAEARRLHRTALDLSGLGLTEVPPELWELTWLETLNLGYAYKNAKNQLTVLPVEIGTLTELRGLSLSYNQLTALPDSLRGLIHLETLNLSFNRLTELPPWLGELTQLRELHCAENHLATLPAALTTFMHLRMLNLYGCELPALPISFGRLTTLTNLHLQGNHFTTLPASFADLGQLQELWFGTDIHHAPLGHFPEVLRSLYQLRVLSVANCDLPILPEWMGELTALESLYAQQNHLTALPRALATLPNLNRLNLDRNPLAPELMVAYQRDLSALRRYLLGE